MIAQAVAEARHELLIRELLERPRCVTCAGER